MKRVLVKYRERVTSYSELAWHMAWFAVWVSGVITGLSITLLIISEL